MTWLLLLACAPDPCAQPWSGEVPGDVGFADFVNDQLDAMRVPGAGVALLRGGEVAWTGGFGSADTLRGEAVDEDTLFMLASVSKLATSVATVLAWDRGLLDLDAPVEVGFSVGDITPRMLLGHRRRRHLDLVPVRPRRLRSPAG